MTRIADLLNRCGESPDGGCAERERALVPADICPARSLVRTSFQEESEEGKMAQKVQVLLIDDLDGSEAVTTVSFSLDGVFYEIDLSADNAGNLRNGVAPYVAHARKANAPARRRQARAGVSREHSADIRSWAKSRGYKVSDRGRIPASIVQDYEREH